MVNNAGMEADVDSGPPGRAAVCAGSRTWVRSNGGAWGGLSQGPVWRGRLLGDISIGL